MGKAGKFGRKMYLCLLEESASFGPRIQHEVEEAVNKFSSVFVYVSRSGKMKHRNLSIFSRHVLYHDLGSTNMIHFLAQEIQMFQRSHY